MDRKNSMLLWRAKDIFIFILSVIGLALLLIYGSKAIAGAGDRRYVEGWQKRPALPPETSVLASSVQPAVLSHIMPATSDEEEKNTDSQNISSAAETKPGSPIADAHRHKYEFAKQALPDQAKSRN